MAGEPVFESPLKKDEPEEPVASKEEAGKDNFEVPDVHLPCLAERKENNKCEKETEKVKQSSENTFTRRPHVMYARFIRTNARFINEPVGYMEYLDVKNDQKDWKSHEEKLSFHSFSPFDYQSTQRSDFKIPACQLVLPTKYYRKQEPACGIVPLAISDSKPVIEKKISNSFPFIHQYRKKLPPKHHGDFLQTDIKPERRSILPKRTVVSQSAPWSCLPKQSKPERGNSMTTLSTAPSFCQLSSRSPISEYSSKKKKPRKISQLLERTKESRLF